jgi:hypothetical protein
MGCITQHRDTKGSKGIDKSLVKIGVVARELKLRTNHQLYISAVAFSLPFQIIKYQGR